jgi:hypothetical protein
MTVAYVFPIVFPIALYCQHRAHQEVASSPDVVWRSRWLNRSAGSTILLWLLLIAVFLVLIFVVGFVGFAISAALDQDII